MTWTRRKAVASRDEADKDAGTVITAEEARQGVTRHRVIRVLAVSLLLSLVALAAFVVWAWRAAP